MALGHTILVFSKLRLETAQQLSVFRNATDPIDMFGESPSLDEPPRYAIEHPNVAGLGRLNEDLAHSSVERNIGENQLECGVEVPNVLRHFLIMPFEFSGDGVERDDAAGI